MMRRHKSIALLFVVLLVASFITVFEYVPFLYASSLGNQYVTQIPSSNIDGSTTYGTHSNFTAEQEPVNPLFNDTLTEGNEVSPPSFGIDTSVANASSSTGLNMSITTSDANDVIILCIGTYYTSNVTITTISDNLTTHLTYSLRKLESYSSGSNYANEWEYNTSWSSSGKIRFTILLNTTPSEGEGVAIAVYGCANVNSPFDTGAGNNLPQVAGADAANPSVSVTTENYDMILGMFYTSSTGTNVVCGSGYTAVSNGTHYGVQYELSSAVSSFADNFTDTSGYYAMVGDAIERAAPVSYGLNLEEQWTNTNTTASNANLCIYMDSFSSDNKALGVQCYTSSGWEVLNSSISANGWCNTTITSYMNSTFTIDFFNSSDTGLTTQSWWNVSSDLIYTWTPTYSLSLEIKNYENNTAISGASVDMNNGTDEVVTSSANGWANYTGVSGSVIINVTYYGYLVNSTASFSVNSNMILYVICNIYNITVSEIETVSSHSGKLCGANVTVYSSSGTLINSGVTANSTGQVNLSALPNATLTFSQYAGSSYNLLIGNTTSSVSSDGMTITLTATQNNVTVTDSPTTYGWKPTG